jgi:hypothetical protein
MAHEEVREALGLEEIEKIPREIYRWQIQGQTGCKFKAEEITWRDGGHMYIWVILQHASKSKE